LLAGDHSRLTFRELEFGRRLACDAWKGPWSDAAELVTLAWRESPDFEYSAEFLAECLKAHGEEPAPAFAAWLDGRLVGFVAALPRRAICQGSEQRLALVTFFAVHPGARARGVGRTLWAGFLSALHGEGFDATIHYCVRGHRSNVVTTAAAAEIGFTCVSVGDVGFLRGLIPGEPAPFTPTDPAADVFEKAAADVPATAISRVWTPREIGNHLFGRRQVVAVTSMEGGDCGAVVGQIRTLADASRTSCLVVEDVLWASLGADARERLVRRFLDAASTRAAMAIVPRLGYADLTPFSRFGFRVSGRTLTMYSTQLSARATPIESTSLYIDVL
jgi:GNAT superfamily N-acetyltransferase